VVHRSSVQSLVAVFLLFIALAAAHGYAADVSTPTLAFDPSALTVSQLQAGDTVYVFGLAREQRGYYVEVVPYERLVTDDAHVGTVTIDIGKPFPPLSIWFAVDYQTGHFVSSAPLSAKASRIEVAGRHLKKNVSGDVVGLAFDAAVAEFVVVRPGIGIWRATIGERGPEDESASGAPSISTAKMKPRMSITAPAPTKLQKGDVVFMLNSFSGEYLATVID
jgi:hypothetical protein